MEAYSKCSHRRVLQDWGSISRCKKAEQRSYLGGMILGSLPLPCERLKENDIILEPRKPYCDNCQEDEDELGIPTGEGDGWLSKTKSDEMMRLLERNAGNGPTFPGNRPPEIWMRKTRFEEFMKALERNANGP